MTAETPETPVSVVGSDSTDSKRVALREVVEGVLSAEELAERFATSARETVEQYTWERRAERVLAFVGEQSRP